MARSGFIALEQPDGLRFALVRGTSILRAGERSTKDSARALTSPFSFRLGRDASGRAARSREPPGADSIRRRGIHTRARQRGASAIVNARAHTETTRLNRLLDRKIEDLKTLLDLGRALVISAVDPMKWREFSDSRWPDIGR